MAMRVGVLGAAGRMGAEVCRAIGAADDLELVTRLGRRESRQSLLDSSAEAVVDFTHPTAVMDNLNFCIRHGIHAVVGTTGFDDQKLSTLNRWLEAAPHVGVLIAPNFSIGAVLLMRYAGSAAAFYQSAEVVDIHHAGKIDAPSGTALRTAAMIAEARRVARRPAMDDATSSALDGARGAVVDDVHVHSLRLHGVVGRTEVIFGGPGEVLTITHDSMDRASFMPGVLRGLREIAGRPGLTVGLEHFVESGL
jgi:4-hydroxy-tetrahydrodipicolinate reductase